MNEKENIEDELPLRSWQILLHEIIFEADTPAGKAFDVILILSIIVSVIVVLLESVAFIRVDYGKELYIAEWAFTIIFTIEYIVRLLSIRRPMLYAKSFFGIIDLLSIIPTYLSIFYAGAQTLLVVRILRLLRIFRILKLAHFIGEARILLLAISASLPKITVFLGTIMSVAIILASLMYIIEGPDNGFTSIPKSIYWTVVTLTTVGYGDITPKTIPGQLLSTIIMLLGYGVIAVPTGIVSVEIANAVNKDIVTKACTHCGVGGHDFDSKYCKNCGARF